MFFLSFLLSMEAIIEKLENMKESVMSMRSDADYNYSDGWRDGFQTAIDRVEKLIQEQA